MADSRLWQMCTSQYRRWETAESTIIKLTRKFVTRQEACQQAGGALAEYVQTRQISLTYSSSLFSQQIFCESKALFSVQPGWKFC